MILGEGRKRGGLSRIFWSAFLLLGALIHPSFLVESQSTIHATFNLDTWLNSHPAIAQKMIWEFPPEALISLNSEGTTLWNQWARSLKWLSALSSSPLVQVVPGSCERRASCPKNPVFLSQLGTGEKRPRDLSWREWPEPYRQKLRNNFDDYSDWLKEAWPLYQQYAASHYTVKPDGFDAKFKVSSDPDTDQPVQDPPVDLQPNRPDAAYLAIVESEAAFDLYVKLVAFQLAMEIGGYSHWSISDFGPGSLADLFDGRTIFQYVRRGPTSLGLSEATGHMSTSIVLPAPPLVAFSFLAQNGILRSTRLETLVQWMEWERVMLFHASGAQPHPDCGKTYGEILWGYSGHSVPVSSMIRGVVMACPLYNEGSDTPVFVPDLRRFTVGCSTTAGFNSQVLRVVNFPAVPIAYVHFRNSFIIEPSAAAKLANDEFSSPPSLPMPGSVQDPYEDGPKNSRVYLGHADDPYGLKGTPDVPTEGLLIDDLTDHQWFPWVDPGLPQAQQDALNYKYLQSVSQRIEDLFIQYLPLHMLFDHCTHDVGVLPKDSYVYSYYFQVDDPPYTVEDLEAKHLWKNINNKIDSLGGCSAIPFPSY